VQAAEMEKQIYEAEKEESRIAKRILANGDQMRKRLAIEASRLDDAMQTDMEKNYQEIQRWYTPFNSSTFVLRHPAGEH
jgi:hypothetical protein